MKNRIISKKDKNKARLKRLNRLFKKVFCRSEFENLCQIDLVKKCQGEFKNLCRIDLVKFCRSEFKNLCRIDLVKFCRSEFENLRRVDLVKFCRSEFENLRRVDLVKFCRSEFENLRRVDLVKFHFEKGLLQPLNTLYFTVFARRFGFSNYFTTILQKWKEKKL